jgi:hypothetical protein
LNQISAKVAPTKSSGGLGKIVKSKFTWLIAGGVGLFVVFAVLGAVLSAGKGDTKADTVWLQARLDSISQVISEYQPKVKSSGLRSSSASLSTVITNTSSKLTNYLVEKYNYKVGSDKDLATQVKTEQDALLNELFEAKITGTLDRVYAHKMTYEITKLMSEEDSLYAETRDDVLKEILDESYGSLKVLYDSFNNFSEGQ